MLSARTIRTVLFATAVASSIGCGNGNGGSNAVEDVQCSPVGTKVNCYTANLESADQRIVRCDGANAGGEGKLSLVEDCAAKNLVCTDVLVDEAKLTFEPKCVTREEVCKKNITPKPSYCK
ncbi:MAG: hypothetical protein U0169_09420 [Polyangiaceae bacterium]